MTKWYDELSYVYDGERATGIGSFVDETSPIGTANRTAAELFENTKYLLANFSNYAALTGASFSGNVSVSVDPSLDDHVATKKYTDTKAKPLRFNFYTALDTWTVNHGLGRDVSVTIFDEDMNQIYAAVKVIDENSLQVLFKVPLRGHVYIV